MKILILCPKKEDKMLKLYRDLKPNMIKLINSKEDYLSEQKEMQKVYRKKKCD